MCNNHDYATHMCRACRQAANNQGQQGQQSPQICVYCGSIEHSSSNCHRRPWDNREQPCGTPKSLRKDQQANSEILGNAMGRTAPMGANTQGHLPQPQSQRSNTGHDNKSSQYYRNYNYDYRESQRQPHARFDKRYNQRYSPPVFPPTPSLNSSFPAVLSKSLLQIAENQLRTIEAMKASQEAQAAAYKEMTKTNKTRDDDTLFHSFEVCDGSNPTTFKRWIDSIDQATHITGRDLRKELLKKSDSVIRNTLSMMDERWTDDAIIAKLCQDFSSLSMMNRVREELKNLYQEPGELITVFISKYRQMHYLSTGTRTHRETHPFAIMGFIVALEPKLNKMVVRKYADAREKPNTLEAIFQMAEQCSKKMLEADSFDYGNTFRVPSTINGISDAEINEVSQGHWNNTRNDDNKNGGSINSKTNITKVKRISTRNLGKTGTKNHGTKTIKNNMVTRSPSPKMLALRLLKMLSIFAPQVLMKVYLMQ